jgi:hypothetical protein
MKPKDLTKADIDAIRANPRPLHVIAADIQRAWPAARSANHPAGAYVDAMKRCTSVNGMYGADSVKSVVQYFLSNASHWRGDDARRIKDELIAMVY